MQPQIALPFWADNFKPRCLQSANKVMIKEEEEEEEKSICIYLLYLFLSAPF